MAIVEVNGAGPNEAEQLFSRLLRLAEADNAIPFVLPEPDEDFGAMAVAGYPAWPWVINLLEWCIAKVPSWQQDCIMG